MLAHDTRLLGDGVGVVLAAVVLEIVLVVLHDLGRDVVSDDVLLGDSLRGGGRAGDRHAGAAPIGNEIGRRGDAGRPAAAWPKVAVVAHLGRGGGVAVITRCCGEITPPATFQRRRRAVLPLSEFGILSKLEAFNSRRALLRDVADDVSNGIGLVLQVAVRNIFEARRGDALVDELDVLLEPAFALLLGKILFAFVLGEAGSNLGDKVVRCRERLDQVLHVVALAADETAKVQDDATRLVSLSRERDIGVLQRRQLLLIPLPLTLQLLGDLLLENKGLESVVTLLLGTGKAHRQTGGIVLLLVNESAKTAVLALVVLNLDLEVLRLLRQLLSEDLEFEEL